MMIILYSYIVLILVLHNCRNLNFDAISACTQTFPGQPLLTQVDSPRNRTVSEVAEISISDLLNALGGVRNHIFRVQWQASWTTMPLQYTTVHPQYITVHPQYITVHPQYITVHPQYSTVHHSIPHYTAVCHSSLQYTAVSHIIPQYSAVHHSTPQYPAVHHSSTLIVLSLVSHSLGITKLFLVFPGPATNCPEGSEWYPPTSHR